MSWTNLENIRLSERNRSQRTIYGVIPFILSVLSRQIYRDRV